MKRHTKLAFFAIIFMACGSNEPQPQLQQQPNLLFSDRKLQALIENKAISEASGLAASIQNKQILWTHNDSGGENKIFSLNQEGKDLAEFMIQGASNRDWEDMAVCKHQNTSYIYVADIGDNNKVFSSYTIYKFKEPNLNNIASLTNTAVEDVEKIQFQYADGSRDAETLLVEGASQDIYIVSKRDAKSRLYVIRFPYSQTSTNTAQFIAELPFSGAVGGSISPSGKEVLIKNYGKVFYWKKANNENLEILLQTKPVELPYTAEPQGEAIAWKADEMGYFTLSEAAGNLPQSLYFYQRK
jgi:hypothetical protein